jgi:penicillin-binding protein 1A
LYFNKSVGDLRIEEGAVLVGMLKANTYYNPRLYPENARERRNVVFAQMEKYGYMTESQKDSLQTLPLVLDYANLESEGPANYFLVQVRKELEEILKTIPNGTEINYKTDGLKVTTTVDYQLQNFSLQAFSHHLSEMQKKLRKQYSSGASARSLSALVEKELRKQTEIGEGVKRNREVFSWEGSYADSISEKEYQKLLLTTLQAGMIGLNPLNGEVLAWVGGIDFRTQPYDQILARRQLASTFKPILYAAALENGMSPCDYVSNSPKVFTDFDDWKPSNYDYSEGGMYSLCGALKKSMNIPSVDVFMHVGFEEVDYLWRKLGFSFPLENSPSLALGTGEASVYELAIAYAAFANGGFLIEPKTILRIEDAEGNTLYSISNSIQTPPVLENRTVQLMNAMLQKVVDEGTAASLRGKYGLRMPLAGKTGTSQNYVDAWFVGYNPSLVVASRVGASNPAIHFNSGSGSGGKLALPLVGLTLQKVEMAQKISYSQRFPAISDTLQMALECPDFREENALEQLQDIFQSDKTTTEKESKKSAPKEKKKKGIFNFWKK